MSGRFGSGAVNVLIAVWRHLMKQNHGAAGHPGPTGGPG